jgi:hypothetical protein
MFQKKDWNAARMQGLASNFSPFLFSSAICASGWLG